MKGALSARAIKNIQTWRRETGGGLVGICAGAVFLCAKGRRGRGLVNGVDLVQDEKFHQAGLQGLVTLGPAAEAPRRFQKYITATRRGMTRDEESSRFAYLCGPVFRVKSRRDEELGGRVAVWAKERNPVAAARELGFATGASSATPRRRRRVVGPLKGSRSDNGRISSTWWESCQSQQR
ncbi:expressed unknown protein [Seminavis robusta]|uniref:Uncharacterized protein n=1 Tax=Seminavis robusta TaxID=568900 RepID=A0A9N8H700_9STRA|nr:expressed unknown protein [Seminavis robusta]|eukprot:Sro127_g060690.1 n/a (180) ;mRNA; f:7951-8490